MEISRGDVRKIFLDLLDGRISREAADRWAYSAMQASEDDMLSFIPLEDRERIWEGVMYLYGIDLQEPPGKYMHTDEDIRRAMFICLGE